jgi:hypothetical protein
VHDDDGRTVIAYGEHRLGFAVEAELAAVEIVDVGMQGGHTQDYQAASVSASARPENDTDALTRQFLRLRT